MQPVVLADEGGAEGALWLQVDINWVISRCIYLRNRPIQRAEQPVHQHELGFENEGWAARRAVLLAACLALHTPVPSWSYPLQRRRRLADP